MIIPKSSSEMVRKMGINEYEFVNLVNKRLKELLHGSKSLLNSTVSNEKITIETAIEEFLSCKLKPSNVA